MQTLSRIPIRHAKRADALVLVAGKAKWRVLEVVNTAAPYLLLWSASRVRVVRPSPANWRLLRDEDLLALSVPADRFRV